jgi:hypothetical protein
MVAGFVMHAMSIMVVISAMADKESPSVAEYQMKTEVYFLNFPGAKTKVKLSKEMAAKIIEIIGRKPTAWSKVGLKAGPSGVFRVGKRDYDYYGFLAFEIDATWGHIWDDEVLRDFWKERTRVGEDIEKLSTYKP